MLVGGARGLLPSSEAVWQHGTATALKMLGLLRVPVVKSDLKMQ